MNSRGLAILVRELGVLLSPGPVEGLLISNFLPRRSPSISVSALQFPTVSSLSSSLNWKLVSLVANFKRLLSVGESSRYLPERAPSLLTHTFSLTHVHTSISGKLREAYVSYTSPPVSQNLITESPAFVVSPNKWCNPMCLPSPSELSRRGLT